MTAPASEVGLPFGWQPGLPFGWQPCPMDTPCGNCGHEMRTHFEQAAQGFAVACQVCDCQMWHCRHGGQLYGV